MGETPESRHMHLVGEYPNLKVVAQLLLLLLSAFPFSQGWPQRIIILQTFLSSTAVSFAPISPISSFTTSTNLLFRLPLLLFPGNSISIIFLPTYSWSLLMTCPYYLSLASLIFIPNRFTLTVFLMYSFLILSFLVTPRANLNIFISATSTSSTCFFVTATVSSPYTIAGLTTKLYTFPFSLRRLLPISSPSVPSCLHSLLYLPLTTTTFLHR